MDDFTALTRKNFPNGGLFRTEEGILIRVLQWTSEHTFFFRKYDNMVDAKEDTDHVPKQDDKQASVQNKIPLIEEIVEIPPEEVTEEELSGKARAMEILKTKPKKAEIIMAYLEKQVPVPIVQIARDLGPLLYGDDVDPKKAETNIRKAIGKMIAGGHYRIAKTGEEVMSLGLADDDLDLDIAETESEPTEHDGEGILQDITPPIEGDGLEGIEEAEGDPTPKLEPIDPPEVERKPHPDTLNLEGIVRDTVRDELRSIFENLLRILK